jgi:hypothetical protein
MWTIDTSCSRCSKKDSFVRGLIERQACEDRKKLIGVISPLTHELNTAEPFVSGPGDGIIIIACNDFSVGE